MKNAHYALLLLDNMPLQGYFVIAKSIGDLDSKDTEEQLNYTIYEDLVMGKKIYPSSYKVNEFINPEEYEEQLKGLKWISRKKISEEEALSIMKKLTRENLLSYEMNIYTSKDKKNREYNELLLSQRQDFKKIKHKKR